MTYCVGEYYERAEDYDLEYQSQSEQDVPFWHELIKEYRSRHVLELACGSGRLGLPLARSFPELLVEGLDSSPQMLAAYRRKLGGEPLEVQRRVILHEGDMRNYHLPSCGDFDLIFLPFNSAGHLYTIEEQLAAFRCTYDHLAPGGRFVVDVLLPNLDYLSAALNRPTQLYLEDEISDPADESTLLIYSSRRYDPCEQLEHMVWIHERFSEQGENERYLTQLDLHMYFPRELQLLFLASGFAVEAIYGDYERRLFGNGTRQIIVGRKRT
ncbi:class I SAM-dependent methyltransferase [Thermogemmatispora carboxidivorans]|uniref:class I SAM-dependent methyltransferase n=1 Tax=Thermogemmatispora carboxidivorans TaxID=1382306 RepID=UPI00069A67F3|nr:class I SAM-dependent methyltransferase [Thermogemmatispora carboxidivorans]